MSSQQQITLILTIQSSFHVTSVLLNILGIICLRKQRANQRARRDHVICHHNLFMSNIAAIEILKMSYDLVPLLTYHYAPASYLKYYAYFEFVEALLMTIFFLAFLLVLFDKVLVVACPMRRRCLRSVNVKQIIGVTWLLGCVVAPVTLVVPTESLALVVYYLVFETLITTLTIGFLLVVRRHYRRRDDKFPKVNELTPSHTSYILKMLLLVLKFHAQTL